MIAIGTATAKLIFGRELPRARVVSSLGGVSLSRGLTVVSVGVSVIVFPGHGRVFGVETVRR